MQIGATGALTRPRCKSQMTQSARQPPRSPAQSGSPAGNLPERDAFAAQTAVEGPSRRQLPAADSPAAPPRNAAPVPAAAEISERSALQLDVLRADATPAAVPIFVLAPATAAVTAMLISSTSPAQSSSSSQPRTLHPPREIHPAVSDATAQHAQRKGAPRSARRAGC